MPKPILSAARTFVKNLVKHTELVIGKGESAQEAIKAINKDARKLKHMAVDGEDRKDHKSALRLVEKGRKAYNAKDYTLADDYFRRALEADSKCSLAYTYLGHTMYQLNRQQEAVTFWQRAIAVAPDSEGAVKARQKLQIIEKKKQDVLKELEGRR